MTQHVIILGGGVAGLSAAHELLQRGFSVEVHEHKPVAGGKARSIPFAGTGSGGRPDLPGEHGFRFFPGFYRHLPDTMKRIPFGHHSVFANLVEATDYLIAQAPDENVVLQASFPESLSEWVDLVQSIFSVQRFGIPREELLFFARRLLGVLTSCAERRDRDFERIAWWDFIDGARKSPAYQTYLAIGLTRTLVALKAQEASTRTVGNILIQLLLDLWSPWNDLDRLLNGPTSEVWIDPWVAHLRDAGAAFYFQSTLVGLDVQNGRIAGARVQDVAGNTRQVRGDHFVVAVPVERFVPLIDSALAAADPALAQLDRLRVSWMNGIQLYLKRDFPLVAGHANYVKTPSALTSISQRQFWRRPLTDYGDGTVNGCLSLDISDWESPGSVFGVPLKDLTRADDIKTEVLAQLRAMLSPERALAVADDNIAGYFLDPGIEFPNGSPTVNLEPLLINTIDSWRYRPEAATRVPNLFLAADYVRTYTDLATMEAANEAARRAVNAILVAARSPALPCELWSLEEPWLFKPAKVLDRWRFERGLPNLILGDLSPLLQPPTPLHAKTAKQVGALCTSPLERRTG